MIIFVTIAIYVVGAVLLALTLRAKGVSASSTVRYVEDAEQMQAVRRRPLEPGGVTSRDPVVTLS